LSFDSESLQRAIEQLPDDFKLVLVGFYFEECSYKELAERLQLPIGTVMSRLSRAKRYLRSQLSEQAPIATRVAGNSTSKLQSHPHDGRAVRHQGIPSQGAADER